MSSGSQPIRAKGASRLGPRPYRIPISETAPHPNTLDEPGSAHRDSSSGAGTYAHTLAIVDFGSGIRRTPFVDPPTVDHPFHEQEVAP